MSIRFQIKNSAGKAEKEGDVIVRYSGTSEPFRRTVERENRQIGVDANGKAKLKFVTGLDTKQVQFYKWFNPEEQAEVKKQIEDMTPLIQDRFGGQEIIDENNVYFWQTTPEIFKLQLSNENMDVFYDTKNPDHALLYLSIIGGAFMEVVAPTRDWADRHIIPHFLALETDTDYSENDDITRSDAHAALADLRKEEGTDALFILAWCMQYETKSFGGYLKSMPTKELINYHIKFIDGKLVSKRKRDTAKVFMDYYEKWKAPQTRQKLMVEAYVKAGEYFAYINQREKKYTTSNGSVLGNTIDEAVTALLKPKMTIDLQELRDQVEKKWRD